MDQNQYLISVLQQQRNQALDAVADVAAQLNVARDDLAVAQAEIDRLRAAATDGTSDACTSQES